MLETFKETKYNPLEVSLKIAAFDPELPKSGKTAMSYMSKNKRCFG